MKRKNFTEKQKKELLHNQNVLELKGCSIIYTRKFKQNALKQYQLGESAVQIFTCAGFDLELIGKENPVKLLSKWRLKKYEQTSEPLSKSVKEKKLIARIQYLEAENEFLKKLEALENQYR